MIIFLRVLAPLFAAVTIMSGAERDLKIIANPALRISEISAAELKSIYLGTKTSLKEGGQIQPVLARDAKRMDQFAAQYLGKSSAALETYYRSLIFTGKGSMPVSLASDEQIIDYVAHTPGAIAFVQESNANDRVKTLRVK